MGDLCRSDGQLVSFSVLIDGRRPNAPGAITDRAFEITFLDPGAQAYVFTFG